MSKTIKYIGAEDNWAELAVTGKQSRWRRGQQEERPDGEAALLIATGFFSGVQLQASVDSVTGVIRSQSGQVISSAPVTIAGGLTIGSTLTASASGGWKVTGGQWLRDGSAISGATALTYQLQAADLQKEISFEPTGLPLRVVAGVATSGSGGGTAPQVFGPFSSLVVIGDSITEQSYLAAADRWANKMATRMGATLLNQGISGTVLQNSDDGSGSARANNGRDRVYAACGGINKRKAVVSNYGFNDARFTSAPSTFNVANFQNDLTEEVNVFKELGYGPTEIELGTTYWMTDEGLNTGSAGFSGQTRTVFNQFPAAVRTVAKEQNVFMSETHNALRDGSGAAGIGTDKIHPNELGTQDIDTANQAATRPNGAAQPTLLLNYPSAGVIAWTIGAVAGAVSYDIEYMAAKGSYQFTGRVTGTSLTGQFTGLAANLYTVQVRANFADGSSSGWTWTRILAMSTTIFAVSFAGTAGTGITSVVPSVGSAYAVQTGYAPASESQTDGAGGVFSLTNAGVYRSPTTPILGNFYTEATFVWKSTLSGDTVGITSHASASANSFYFFAWFQTNNTWRLYRNLNGNNAQMSGGSWSGTFTSGQKVPRMAFKEMEGFLRITCSVDGQVLGYCDDPAPLPLGGVGIRDAAAKTSTTGIHVLNQVVVLDPL